MGQENSAQTHQKKTPQITRAHTIATNEGASSSQPSASQMDASIISTSEREESEFEYLRESLKPIGDSPKKKVTKNLLKKSSTIQSHETNRTKKILPKKKSRDTWRRTSQDSKSGDCHKIVVVNEGIKRENHPDTDIQAIQELPIFQPIIRGTLGLSLKDKDSLATLNAEPLQAMASKYQEYLRNRSEAVVSEQNSLTKKVKEIDAEISRLLSLMVERQRFNARTAERLSKVHEMSSHLSRCHSSLNQCLELAESLNHMLPVDDRLDPFVWTTG